MIRINVFISADEAVRAMVIESASALTAASLKEEGCIAYDIFESSTRKNVLMICETWQDEAHLAVHQATEHFKKYVGEIEAVAQMKIESFNF